MRWRPFNRGRQKCAAWFSNSSKIGRRLDVSSTSGSGGTQSLSRGRSKSTSSSVTWHCLMSLRAPPVSRCEIGALWRARCSELSSRSPQVPHACWRAFLLSWPGFSCHGNVVAPRRRSVQTMLCWRRCCGSIWAEASIDTMTSNEGAPWRSPTPRSRRITQVVAMSRAVCATATTSTSMAVVRRASPSWSMRATLP